MSPAFEPSLLVPGDPAEFPDPGRAGPDGLVALGGDLSPDRLRAAYAHGIFPWFDEDTPPLWWSPDPRAVLDASHLHVSRRLEGTLRSTPFVPTWNREFRAVIRACALDRADGTWLVPEMVDAYTELHRRGFAHSFELRDGEELVGGLYGVQIGALFAAESMFHLRRDASKIALVLAVRGLAAAGIELFDVQFLTPHLEQFGAREIPRERYLDRVAEAVAVDVELDPAIVLGAGQ